MMKRSAYVFRLGFGSAAVAASAWLGACAGDDEPSRGGSGGVDGDSDGGPLPVEWPHLDCDPLVPEYCAFPFPSNVYTVADPTSRTGRRVQFKPGSFPTAANGTSVLPDPWNKSDGFSPGSTLLAQFPGVTLEGVPTPKTIARSLEAASPTVVIDATTGQRVPHFAELDMSGGDDTRRSFIIRPVVRLEDATRYIVAIRGLKGASGNIEPSPAFKALRDSTPFDDLSVAARVGLYEDIFTRLEQAGVGRADLQLAWDFTTASRENNTDWLLHMRDEALELVGPDGPSYVIDSVDSTHAPESIAYRINGRMTVPLYLDDADDAPGGPGSNLVFGADGLPEPNASKPTYEVPFEVLIPHSAATTPAALIQYGHGLLGRRTQIESGHFATFMNELNYIFFAVNLDGMAADDRDHIAAIIVNGDIDRFSTMFDRQHQGMLNYLLAMRMMIGRFADDPTYGQYIDRTQRYYHGISQGGIFGGTYMGLTTDVTRGVLGVMGQPYLLLLNRSIDFEPFFQGLMFSFPDARDQQLGLDAIQMLWDRVEPNGYSKYIQDNPLPNTPPHQILMRAAVGDHQVTTLGAHVMARAVGAKHLDTGIRDVFGLEKVTSVESGSSYIEYDFGLPEEPMCNIPNQACDDPHGKIRALPEARAQMDEFLRTGRTTNHCSDGICKFPALSGCAAGEGPTPCP